MPRQPPGRSVRRRLITIILLTSGSALALTCAIFFGYEFVTFRRTMVQDLTTIGRIIATNSTAALAFENRSDAQEVLAALKAEPYVIAAGLYRKDGSLLAHYPADLPTEKLPAKPGPNETRVENGYAMTVQPVVQGNNERLGSLVLMASTEKLTRRLRLYGLVIALVLAMSVAAAYVIGQGLQRAFSEPILALANTARAVSQQHDYSVRASAVAFGEIGQLNDAFNHMLERIDEQTRALSRSEERHRLLFENSPLPMWVYDLETLRFLAVNGAATNSYGYSAAEFLAMTIEGIRPADELPALREDITQSPPGFARNRRIWKHRKKDGTVILVEITSHDLTLDGRHGRLVLANDVTARLHAEDEVRRLNENLEDRIRERTSQLEAANHELEAFSYSVSHDLRAPLRHVHGYVAMLKRATEGQLSDKADRYLKIINDAAVEMGQLIDDLLEFSRMGRMEIAAGEVALDEIVHESVNRLKAGIADRNIVWQIGPLPLVTGDPAMLRQVFANLIGNAVKYTRKRAPATIEIGALDESKGEATIFVRDNGAGFDMKYADKLFGVFQRLHRSEEFEGTGIGLATVRRIIVRHGGRVWAEAKVDAGATFYFTLRKAPEQLIHHV
jgi:PAS domain S-box-containing protein